MKFDEMRLFWIENNKLEEDKNKFLHIGNNLKDKLRDQNLCKKIFIEFLNINNPVDHNEIYPKLLEYCKSLDNSKHLEYTAAISSGTPAMQVCWILMAESVDFKLNLIRTNEPSFNQDIITPVKLGTGLPRIQKIEKENKILKDLLPEVEIYIKERKLLIGKTEVSLHPMEFCYYRYFLEKAKRGNHEESIPDRHLPKLMVQVLNKYYKESFPYSDKGKALENAAINNDDLPKSILSENMANIKKKIINSLEDKNLAIQYTIKNLGNRNDGVYLIDLDKKKIKIFERSP